MESQGDIAGPSQVNPTLQRAKEMMNHPTRFVKNSIVY